MMYRSNYGKIIWFSLLTAIFMIVVMTMQSQVNQTIPESEEKLKQLFDEIMGNADDEERMISGEQFSTLFQQTLIMDGSFEYSFPLLSSVSKLISPKKRFRVYTWNVPLHSGMNRFYGLIQLNLYPDSLRVIELVDKSREISDPETAILSPERWYGAIYYEMITKQTANGEVLYTLLGWHGDNMLMNSKLIEVLTITPQGEIRIGKPVFCNYTELKPTRIIFRHSANATMSLRYEEQSIVTEKRWNAKRREFDLSREKTHLIVADRLVPSDPQLEGQYEYYLPAGDMMDGFLFRDACWNFIEEIDARNPTKK